ncbi:MAG: alpha/beta hydrolase, partial [Planctomycetota bacterium]
LSDLSRRYAWEKLVVVGFSQGVAMAWRVLADSLGEGGAIDTKVDGLVSLAGDVPPDVREIGALKGCGSPILLGRGLSDKLYPEEKLAEDVAYCDEAGVNFVRAEFSGGHGWEAGFTEAVDAFLEGI